jgi:hypothetical protein
MYLRDFQGSFRPRRFNVRAFERDGFTFNEDMKDRYSRLEFYLETDTRLQNAEFKDARIFDVRGILFYRGDFTRKDVQGLLGAHYVLSSDRAFYHPFHPSVLVYRLMSEQERERTGIAGEPLQFTSRYVKMFAYARIIDGVVDTDAELKRMNR